MKTYVTLTLGDIGLIIVISMLVAVAVQVWFQSRAKAQAETQGSAPFKPAFAAPQSAFADVPYEHLAAIAAAVAATMGMHRIVRIETPDRGHGWTAEARTVHHTSHAPR